MHYFIGIDTAYSNAGGSEAKCAAVVIKGTEQEKFGKKSFFRKVVNIFDFPAPDSDRDQAMIYRKLYNDYLPKAGVDAGYTLIGIDASVSGNNIVAELMRDLGDGFPPLKCTNGWKSELELPDAMAAILPIKALGACDEKDYVTLESADLTVSDRVLFSDLRREFANRNIQLLTDILTGVAAYNKKHDIKDTVAVKKENPDECAYDYARAYADTALPYIKTQEFVGQARNLKVVKDTETRISERTNRDMWSALKMANRVATILERQLFRPSRPVAPPPEKRRDYRSHGGFSRLKTAHGGRRR